MKIDEQWMHGTQDRDQKITEGHEAMTVEDRDLMTALGHFKASVHAWSETEYSRPRAVTVQTARRWSWRLAAIGVSACALIVGAVSGVHYASHPGITASAGNTAKNHQQQPVIAPAEQRIQVGTQVDSSSTQPAGAAKTLTADRATDEESLLAAVDRDVSRQVPSAFEPLAQMTDSDLSE